jgi:predicted enzyme related to lactoylglutathione lyase
MAEGSLAYVEFFTSDLEKTRAFYTSVFGWRLEAKPGWEGHLLFHPREGIGGLFKLKPEAITDKGPIVHVVATDIAAALVRIKEAGGRTIIPMTAKETEAGLEGFFALAEDNVGNRIGLST